MGPYGHGPSLLTGRLPTSHEAVAALVLTAVVLRRAGRRWYLGWLPLAAVAGGAVALLVRHRIDADGLTADPPPAELWIWLAARSACRASGGRSMRRKVQTCR